MKFENILLEEILNSINDNIIQHIEQYVPASSVEHYHNKNKIIDNHPTYSYTCASRHINKSLWEDADGRRNLKKSNSIITEINKTKPAADDFSVYSGIRRNPQELVKDSGGIIHHAAFMSTSILPSIALRFSSANKDTRVKHLLKIKVRKGQKVGAYLGDTSEHDYEKEYLLKANQLLKIHPQHDTYKDINGDEIRVHHAIVLEPHEYEHLGEHDEVKKFNRLRTSLNNAVENEHKDIDNLIASNSLDSQEDYNFNKRHIESLIDKPEYHETLAKNTILDRSHIDKMIGYTDNNKSLASHLSKQPNLSDEHIKKLISLNFANSNNNLINNKSINLPKEFIDKVSKSPIYHSSLASSKHIDGDHITEIIKNADSIIPLRTLSIRDDLGEKHINDLIDTADNDILVNLSTNKNLTNGHINRLLDYTKQNKNILMGLSTNKNLTNVHKNKIITNAKQHSKSCSDYVENNIMNKYI